MTEIIGEVWVCTDCYAVHHSGEMPEPGTFDYTPWSLLPGADVSDWTTDADDDPDGDESTWSGWRDFSSRPCQGCGSHLAGNRARFAVWSWGETTEPCWEDRDPFVTYID